MCESCSGLTRRTLLSSLGLAAASLAAGCAVGPQGNALVENLPYEGPDEAPHGGPPPLPPKIQVPDTPKTQVNSEVGPVVPRSAWTVTGPDASHLEPMGGVRLVTFHHSGDGKAFLATDATEVARHLEGVRLWHRQRGMADIGYHFAIDRAGRVWQLRHLKYEGQHVRPSKTGIRWNAHNVGVVVLGDFSRQQLSPAQKDRIASFAKFLVKHYELKAPAMKIHGELVQTDCPGKFLSPAMKGIRSLL